MAAAKDASALLVSLHTTRPWLSYGAETSRLQSAVRPDQEFLAGEKSLEPMPSLNADSVRREFNATSDKVRIVALLSPTCVHCRSGHRVVGDVLKELPSPNLQGMLIWEPMRVGDSPYTAARQALTVQDPRISQGWIETEDVGKLFAQTLKLRAIAWDVYLIYESGIQWNGRLAPSPNFWMHQLENVDPELLLYKNPTRLETEVGKLLRERALA